jgi:hypothetical protein
MTDALLLVLSCVAIVWVLLWLSGKVDKFMSEDEGE